MENLYPEKNKNLNSIFSKTKSKPLFLFHLTLLLLLFLVWSPGLIHPDALRLSILGFEKGLNTWHSLLPQLLYRSAYIIPGGLKLNLLFQLLLFVSFSFLLTKSLFKNSWLSILASILLTLTPFVFVHIALIARDILFALFLGIAICFALLRDDSKHKTLLSLFFLLLASLTRQEGVIAGLPVIFLLLRTTQKASILKSILGCLFFIFAFFSIEQAWKSTLVKHVSCPERATFITDLYLLSIELNDVLLKDVITKTPEQEWRCHDVMSMKFFKKEAARASTWSNKIQRCVERDCSRLRQIWLNSMISNPTAAIKIKLLKMKKFMLKNQMPRWWKNVFESEDFNIQRAMGSWKRLRPEMFKVENFERTLSEHYKMSQHGLIVFLTKIYQSKPLTPFYYGLVAAGVHALSLLSLLVFSKRKQSHAHTAGLAFIFSGAFHLFAIFLFSPGVIPRQLFWFWISAVAAFIIAISECLRARDSKWT